MSAIRRRDTHRPMRQSGGGQRVIDCAKDRIAGRAVREAHTRSRAMRSRGKASLARLRLVRKRRKVRRKWERRQTEVLEIVRATFQPRSRIQQVE
jgi:hypothetical protein